MTTDKFISTMDDITVITKDIFYSMDGKTVVKYTHGKKSIVKKCATWEEAINLYNKLQHK